jgi:disulfide bond formation protein DsbB
MKSKNLLKRSLRVKEFIRHNVIKKYGLYTAWLIATCGMLLSLYFSDVKHYEPCHLCWYQRICLFPLSLLLGIAIYRGFLGIALYAIPQALFGLLLALYQIAIQEIPGWNPIDMCGAGPNCTEKIMIGLGPITIPMLSAVGFFTIALILITIAISDLPKKLQSPTQKPAIDL